MALGIIVSLLIAYLLWRNFLDLVVAAGSIVFGFSVYADEGIWLPAIALCSAIILVVSFTHYFFNKEIKF
jgi:hypothetical protein